MTAYALGAEALRSEVEDLWRMCDPATWVTADPLGAGGLLVDAWWVARLASTPGSERERLRHG